jgi:uncharacterized RDD family membrane protein YckC
MPDPQSTNWFYVDAGKQAGPVSEPHLEELFRAGQIQPDTLIWREGLANWQPYRDLKPGSVPPIAGPSPLAGSAVSPFAANESVCVECGRIFPVENMIQYGNSHVCASCKPVFMQKLAEGARVNTGNLRYAGFWIRTGAKLLDGLILGAVLVVPIIIFFVANGVPANSQKMQTMQLLIQLPFLVVNMGYQIFFLGKYGATPGKMACGIRVVTAEGERFGYGRATGRFFAEMLSGIVCYIGYIIAAFDDQKRALHDHLCSTRVIYK